MTEFNSPPPEAPDTTGLRVAVLMATYNGADCIEEQLESICRQSRRPDLILVSDDGSIDFTPTIIERFSDRNPACEIRLLPGPRKGSARNN